MLLATKAQAKDAHGMEFLPGRLLCALACARWVVWVCMLCCLVVLVGVAVDALAWRIISARKEIARCDQVSHVQTHHRHNSSSSSSSLPPKNVAKSHWAACQSS